MAAEFSGSWDMGALQAAFVHLTDDLKAEVRQEMVTAAEVVKSATLAQYPSVTGDLRRDVRTLHRAEGSRVRTAAPHSHLYELGTVVRANRTRKQANRGAMPAARVFIPAAVQVRSALLARLQARLDTPREIL